MRHGGQQQRIEARVEDLWPEDRWVKAQVGVSVAGRSGSWMKPCAIRIIHVEEMRSTGLVVWASKPLRGFPGLASKPVAPVC